MFIRAHKTFFVFVSVLIMLIASGCAGNKQAAPTPLQDMEHWSKLAETSKGYSPSPTRRELSITDYRKQLEEDKPAVRQKPLPTRIVSMKMRNTELKAILRAMAQAANMNVLLKDDVKGVATVEIEGVPWDQVFVSLLKSYGLTYTWEGEILRILTQDDMEQLLKTEMLREKQREQSRLEIATEPLSTVLISLDYADARGLRDNLQEFLPKDKDGKNTRGSVRVDEHSNSLIIQATREDIKNMIPIIERIDKPTPQILIRANIVETSKEVARDLGIQWGGMLKRPVNGQNLWVMPGGSGAGAIKDPVTGGLTPASGSIGASGQGFGVNFPVSSDKTSLGALGLMYGTLGGNILEMQLQALQSDGKINIISSPSITTVDNKMAFTESGEKVPYVSTSSGSGGATQEVKFENAVLRLEITPHVIDGKNLKMRIVVRKDEVDMTRQVQGNPFIIKKQTETTLIIQDGETIVISGLSRQRKAESVSGVPGLKDIPLLGWLFKGESIDDITEEVIIFITPHILPQKTAAVSVEGDAARKE
ncbi:MAG: type IV pilus secretin PilQ [Syntrophales bacterium LBB04]|nr:type IV pilus secretin PilQ [Syntrophales bacterium LBB04]